jgi:hypothetical protein
MRTFVFFVLLALLIPRARALDLSIQAHHFTWEERDADGRQLLEESGPLLGLGVSDDYRLRENLTWQNSGELFLGEVDYDGSTQLGEPLRTTTAYYGGMAQSRLRWNLAERDDTQTGPLGGLATRAWLRRLDNSARDNNGYDEAWWMVYGVLGWFVEQPLDQHHHLFAEAALRLPLYNNARYSLVGPEGDGNVAVEPGREWSYEAAAGLRTTRWRLALAYETFSFGRSASKPLPPFEIFQPESEGRQLSLRISLIF